MKSVSSVRHVVGTLSRSSSSLVTKLFFALLLLAASAPLRAADFYAAPTGSSSGAGTLASPWDLRTAFNGPSAVKPGDTIWLRGGTYQVGGKSYRWQPKISGNSSAYITIRNYDDERAIIDGPIVRNSGVGGYVKFWGLEVTCSIPGRTTTQNGSWPTTWQLPDGLGATTEYCVSGLFAAAPYDKFINCYVHDVIGGGIGVWTSGPGVELSGNLITQNGWNAPDRSHGHGIYGQNSKNNPRRLVRDNILLYNADHGAQFYGSVDVVGFDVIGNVFADNGALYPSSPGGANVLLGAGSISSNNLFAFNSVFRTPGTKGDGMGDHDQGYDQNTVGLVMSNNLIASKSIFNIGTDSRVTGNRYYGPRQWHSGLNDSSFSGNTVGDSRPTTGQDAILRPNSYDSNRANLTVFNWGLASTLSVNVAGFLSPGDTYELHNAANYYGDVVTGTCGGSTISVPMTGHTVAKPIEAAAPASTFPAFGVFIVVKTGTGSVPANSAPTITAIANQSIGLGSLLGTLAVTVNDDQTAAGNLTLTASSSNSLLLPTSAIVLGGSGANRTVLLNPLAGLVGSATVTLTVSDGSLSTSTSFTLTVKALSNTGPTISSVAGQTIDAGSSVGPLTVTVGDSQSSAGNLTLTASSSNTALVPSNAIVLGGSGANRSITITPSSGQTGSATITLTVSDGSLSASTSFTLTVTTVTEVNNAPTISSIANQTMNVNTSFGPMPVTIGDEETPGRYLTLAASSSNPTLVPNSAIIIGGSGWNRTLTITPVANQTGSSIITLTSSDGATSSTRSFTLTVISGGAIVTISTSSSPVDGGTTSGGGSPAAGASMTVNAAANAGYSFVNWTEGGKIVSISSSYSFTATANRNLVANFSPTGLPSPWQTQDIGGVGATGSASYNNGAFTIAGSGADIWNNADEFRYVYQLASGDCDIRARVTSVQNVFRWCKAGVMIRESLSADSSHASMYVTPGKGVVFQQRAGSAATSITTGSNTLVAPYWVRVIRVGNTFTGYSSADGNAWTVVGTTTISMAANVYIGLPVSSHTDGTLCTSVMDNVTAIP